MEVGYGSVNGFLAMDVNFNTITSIVNRLDIFVAHERIFDNLLRHAVTESKDYGTAYQTKKFKYKKQANKQKKK